MYSDDVGFCQLRRAIRPFFLFAAASALSHRPQVSAVMGRAASQGRCNTDALRRMVEMYLAQNPGKDIITCNGHFLQWAQTDFLTHAGNTREARNAVQRAIRSSPSDLARCRTSLRVCFNHVDVELVQSLTKTPKTKLLNLYDLRCREESLSPE